MARITWNIRNLIVVPGRWKTPRAARAWAPFSSCSSSQPRSWRPSFSASGVRRRRRRLGSYRPLLSGNEGQGRPKQTRPPQIGSIPVGRRREQRAAWRGELHRARAGIFFRHRVGEPGKADERKQSNHGYVSFRKQTRTAGRWFHIMIRPILRCPWWPQIH